VRSLRGGGPPPPAPATWAAAKAATVAYRRVIREALGQAPPEEVLRQLTSMTALCERSEELFRDRSAPAAWRCQSCPLFHALGGRPIDVGCRSVRDPIITAVRAGDLALARAEVDEVIRLLEEMPLPQSKASVPETGAEGRRAAGDVGT